MRKDTAFMLLGSAGLFIAGNFPINEGAYGSWMMALSLVTPVALLLRWGKARH